MAGGYQTPAAPAPVSGPGALSARTDGGPADTQAPMVAPGGAYGDRTDMLDLQASAPMEAAPSMPMEPPTPFSAPSQRPSEPVTSGVASGPGAGPEALSMGTPQYRSLTQVLAKMAPSDTSGEVGAFLDYAQRNGW